VTRTPYRHAVRTLGAALFLPLALLAGCGLLASRDGTIEEVEVGRNGVAVEVRDGDDTYEVYLVPGMQDHCQENERLADCADADDYLVTPPGATPGRRTEDR